MKRILIALPLLLQLAYGQPPNPDTELISESNENTFAGKMFLPGVKVPTARQTWAITSADLNLDGAPDLIVADKPRGTIIVHLNDGTGAFKEHKSFKGIPQHRAIAAADFNRDGYPDLATVTLKGEISIYINNRVGGLRFHQKFKSASMLHDLVIQDLNNDGRMDLLVVAVMEHQVNIHFQTNRGAFGPAKVIPTGETPRVAALGDLDGDEILDLVVGADDGRLHIHRGLGHGNFQEAKSIRSTNATWGLGLADFNGDGFLDIAAASYVDKNLFVHLNNGRSGFEREIELISGDHNFEVATGDFDLDGDTDIATCSSLDKNLNFHINDGQAGFSPKEMVASGEWNTGITTADFDGDGDPDIGISSANSGGLFVHTNVAADTIPVPDDPICITGTVFHGETGEVIANAPITLHREVGRSYSQKTDEKGGFSMCPSPGNTYQIIVRTPGMPVHSEFFTMPEKQLHKDIYLYPNREAQVYGKIWDQETGQYIPKAVLTIFNEEGNPIARFPSSDQGAYRRMLTYDKSYRIQAEVPGMQSAMEPFKLEAEHTEQGLRVDLKLDKMPEGACIEGIVRDEKDRSPVPFATILVMDTTGKKLKRVQTDGFGYYQACLKFGSYQFKTDAIGYFFNLSEARLGTEHIDMAAQHNIKLIPLEENASIVLQNIYFDKDEATLTPESVVELDRLYQIMSTNPSLVIEIGGHTDSDASDAYNLDLSQRRSESVIQYLQDAGIASDRLEAKGYGESKPIASNDTEEGKQLNRRTEFKVLSY
ncbi:FG-GAP-like repeat-containing protein [Pontibacter sp. G13]|uniref:FG-GAP-like repeat-containing protein n=1 Tax=Pontibacter sp. G13 TaxID=3074898 RepID=UPI00288B81AD|nr:FG-GAP-like repeat-containing protein [Pontibacter sp. G13]WNJ17242.1 FG-GAP-like repeat-containing protein [Pontibacter sp. G13]